MAGLKCGSNSKAFSLLEVIIMVGILSTGIVIILQALSLSAGVTGLSCDIIKAAFLTEDKIQELEFKEKRCLVTVGEESGKIDKFNWNYKIDSAGQGLKLYKLDFEVSWQRAGRQEGLGVSTYLMPQNP